MAFGPVLALGALNGLGGWGADSAILWAYNIVVFLVAVGLFADLAWGRWAQATVTGLVVDLGVPGSVGTLRDRLARALGDPTLAIGYWLPDARRYVDEAGRPLELPAAGSERVVTPIEEDGRRIAALVHDAAVLEDPGLVSAVASATRLAVSNARLQAEVRARVVEVEASRRRIVEAADRQRRRLEEELRHGAERRLAGVTKTLEGCGPVLAEVREGLDAARSELREFASGIHPATLTRGGLAAALAELAERSPAPVRLSVPGGRLPAAVEVAVYFTCSEALANVGKYARPSRVTVVVEPKDDRLLVQVADDGVGGADPARGSGSTRSRRPDRRARRPAAGGQPAGAWDARDRRPPASLVSPPCARASAGSPAARSRQAPGPG
jgi:signal transduction histidine kinase